LIDWSIIKLFDLVDANIIKNKDEIAVNTNSLSRLENNESITNKIVNDTASNNEEQSEIELSESDLQLQVRKMNAIIFIMLETVFLSYYYLIIYLNCFIAFSGFNNWALSDYWNVIGINF